MSRLERHKLRREGHVTGIGKGNDDNLVDDPDFEDSFDINPITEPEQKVEAPRKRVLEQVPVDDKVDVDELKEQAKRTKTELFDIDQAFNQLRKERAQEQKETKNDTQLDIMAGIFSDNEVEYNNTVELKREPDQQKEAISEEELMKILEKKEKNHIKKVAKKRKADKKNIVSFAEETTEPYLKEDLEIEDIIEADNNDSVKRRINSTNGFDDFSKSLDRKSIPLVIVLVVLALVLVFLIYNFISKR